MLGFYILIIIVILAIDYGWFISLNQKFIDRFPGYSGKYLWTLLFFPIVFQVSIILSDINVIVTIFSFTGIAESDSGNYVDKMLFRTLRNWSIICIFLYLILTFVITKCRTNVNNLLFDWNENHKKEITNQMAIIIGAGIFIPIIYSAGAIVSIYNNDWLWLEIRYQLGDEKLSELYPNMFLGYALLIGLGTLLWYFTKRKINNLSNDLGIETKNVKNDEKVDIKPEIGINSINSITQLKELKQLFDNDIISEEEFTILKKEILNNGILT